MNGDGATVVSHAETELEQSSFEGDDEGDLGVEVEGTGLIVSKNDRSLSELHRWKQKGRLIIDPEWQRSYVWDTRRASKLIESVLIDIPIPVVYLAEDAEGRYEVIDGRQRLTSVFDFFEGKFSLSGLEFSRDLIGLKFGDLNPRIQGKLEDATFRTFELSSRTPKDMMFIIFERLNTGGMALNDMEIRNCLYRGPLNDLLKELSELPDFKTALNTRNLDRRMLDRSLILRFLAFYEKTPNKAKAGLKKFLNEFFETYRSASQAKLEEFRVVFRKAMKCSVAVFGDHAFRLPRDKSRGGGEWASRPNAAIFQTLSSVFADYDVGAIHRASDRILEEYLDLVSKDQKWVDAVTKATGDSANIAYAFEEWQRRMRIILSDIPTNDSQRLFSRQLKKEMWNQNPNCSLCGTEIKVLNDAVLDHAEHYWRGGKTVPENARLAHRHCNLSREH